MTELEKLVEEYEKRTGNNAIEEGVFNEYARVYETHHTFGFVLDLVKTITHLRSLTRWHEGVPEEDGEYLIKVNTGWGYIRKASAQYVNGKWDNPNNLQVVAFAYLPKEGE